LEFCIYRKILTVDGVIEWVVSPLLSLNARSTQQRCQCFSSTTERISQSLPWGGIVSTWTGARVGQQAAVLLHSHSLRAHAATRREGVARGDALRPGARSCSLATRALAHLQRALLLTCNAAMPPSSSIGRLRHRIPPSQGTRPTTPPLPRCAAMWDSAAARTELAGLAVRCGNRSQLAGLPGLALRCGHLNRARPAET
jgi:hypothetical protein